MLATTIAAQSGAQPSIDTIPVSRGMIISQVLKSPTLERESIRTLTDVSPRGIGYTWSFVEVRAGHDTVRGEHKVFVRAADADTAGKIHEFYRAGEVENPGYTRYMISRRVFDRLLATRFAEVSILTVSAAVVAGTNRRQWVPDEYQGRLHLSRRATEPFSLLLNGQRVNVPALRIRSSVKNAKGYRWDTDMLILADREHPLMLYYTKSANTLRTVRIDQPQVTAAALERTLTSACRAEVAGIYFESNSAELSKESDETIATIADILSRRNDWRLTIEGHTDSIGPTESNQLLSDNRARAVQQRLISRHRISANRLRSAGHGESKPLETNATLEGRARNRRVEIVRPC